MPLRTSSSFAAVLVSMMAMVFLPRLLAASCGAEDCPLSSHGHAMHGRFAFDLTYQYIDQDRVQIGTHRAEVGELASPEDEISTIGRTVTLAGRARLSSRWGMSASLPFVDRIHRHFHNHEGEEPELQVFRYSGVGDLSLLGHWMALGSSSTSVTLQAGAKLPTGKREVEEVDHHQPEPPARPGTGSTDLLMGVHAMRMASIPALFGSEGVDVPLFAGVLGRINGEGTEGYRVGNELQINVGAAYPITERLTVLGQINARERGKDDIGDTDATRDNTGGRWLWLSPGLRFVAGPWATVYGYVQIPIVQDVNRIQLVSPYHVLVGTTIPIGGE